MNLTAAEVDDIYLTAQSIEAELGNQLFPFKGYDSSPAWPLTANLPSRFRVVCVRLAMNLAKEKKEDLT